MIGIVVVFLFDNFVITFYFLYIRSCTQPLYLSSGSDEGLNLGHGSWEVGQVLRAGLGDENVVLEAITRGKQ